MQTDGTAADSGGRRAWLPFLWIIVASAAAHLWCLGAQFYMDDFPQIVNSDAVKTGAILSSKLVAWTRLGYVIQYHLFGMSPVGFHAVNWLLHTASACVLFGFGRDFLREKWPAGVAWFAALLFAVHPLASEIPNYARAQDLAWVTLFSLSAGWLLLGFLRGGSWWKLGGCVLCVLGAMISKGPGLFHALMVCGVIGLTNFSPDHWRFLRTKGLWIVGAAGVVLFTLWMAGMLDRWLRAISLWSEPRFIGHGYTVARVFWEFAWRCVIPVGLSSDHHIAETLVPPGSHFWNIPDKIAMLSMAGMLALAGLGAVLAWRGKTRVVGACLLLFVGTILFRVLYLIPEFMPEYRIYPGMPWFCLGAAVVLAAVWRWMFAHVSPVVPAVALLAVFAGLSAKRSILWHDLDRLMADVLKRYPAQGRAVWELHDRDLAAGNWQAVITRQEQVWPEVRRKFIAELQRLAPGRELPTGHFSLAECACMGRYARAVAIGKSPAEGLRRVQALEAYLRAMKIDPSTNPAHWNNFARDKALVLETGGNYQAALDALTSREEGGPPQWPRDHERIRRKLAGAQP
ncbi:MAG: hypothetical protein V4584_16010 [Verrucomicrobiota bacterium]